ncbi:MAG TPA: polysaccharide deacetylase family protein [Kiritimatiellia bacterium]|nr:MAG: putative nucleoside transporter YegT [Verrucomicrobia bacterium ADurb.Bin070]HQQ90470.1 polysaccharide deacetylase family protein [Kiritimatiellia bacterium]
MKSTLVIGYDVERIPGRVPGEKWVGRPVPEDTTTRFLKQIVDIHRAVNVPATIFMVGANIEAHRRELEACLASGLFEIAQHTHEHYPLKSVVEETGSRVFLKGLAFAFFFDAAFIYVNRVAPPEIRGSAQALYTTVTLGLGLFVGTRITGAVMDRFRCASGFTWRTIFLVPCFLLAVCALAFIFFFNL